MSGNLSKTITTPKMEVSEFYKEMPTSVKRIDEDNRVKVSFKWEDQSTSHMQIEYGEYLESEFLPDFYRVNARDGTDTVCAKHLNCEYILRKTGREVAIALLNAHGKISNTLENIVGYLRTVLGNYYIISKISSLFWTFDSRLKRTGMKYVSIEHFDEQHKDRLVEMIIESLSKLHSKSVLLGGVSLNKLLLTDSGVQFSDLREMRVARKKSHTVEEFKNTLRYLFSLGLVKKEQMFYPVAMYLASNEKGCKEWDQEENETGRDSNEIALRLEREIIE